MEPEALDQLMMLIRSSLLDHIHLMQTAEYQEQLRRKVRLESIRNKQLRERARTLEAHVARLQREGLRMLAAGLQQCSIHADKPADFFGAARRLIKRHKELDSQVNALDKECTTLEARAAQLQRTAVPKAPTKSPLGSVSVHDYISGEVLNQYLQYPTKKKESSLTVGHRTSRESLTVSSSSTVLCTPQVAPLSNHHIIKQRLSPAHAAAAAQQTGSVAPSLPLTELNPPADSTYSPISNPGEDSETEEQLITSSRSSEAGTTVATINTHKRQVNGFESTLSSAHVPRLQHSYQVDWSNGGKRPRLASLMAGVATAPMTVMTSNSSGSFVQSHYH